MNSLPSQIYKQKIDAGLIQDDPAQRAVITTLDNMATELRRTHGKSVFGLWLSKPKAIKGLYLWGPVGRGKTLMTELFIEALSGIPYQRWHFHRFMNDVHRQLADMPDTADTLTVLAKKIATNCRLLVLDEFFVSDIGDAMILYRLLEQLNERGVSFVSTSNVPPDELYLNGLQRTSFLPCIDLIKRECEIVELLSAQDYRLRTLQHAKIYLVPPSSENELVLAQQYVKLSGQKPGEQEVDINDRLIPAKALSAGVVWFDFRVLCDGPRSAADYIEIARDFHTVMVSGVPQFNSDNEEAARRFVYLIDELYDRHVNLLLTAETEAVSLYSGHRLKREFERTCSRLIEMQSTEFLALEHRP
jgi:cell division protein ZapE